MSSMLIGYARVSKQDQELSLQLDALTNFGCIKIFEEKISGANRSRPELENMLEMLRENDTVVVWKLDRLARSTKHLIELMELFNEKKVNFVSLKENIDTTTATGKMMFHIFAALAEFERETIKERTQAGIEAARARGRNGGRPKLDQDKKELALKMYDSREYSIKQILDATKISKSTLYKYIRERKS